jgi:hypothetical protein
MYLRVLTYLQPMGGKSQRRAPHRNWTERGLFRKPRPGGGW